MTVKSLYIIYVHKHKYLFASKLYLKFHLHLAGADLNGLSLNAAYGTKEELRGDFIVLHNIYKNGSQHATWRMRNVASCWVFRRAL